MEQLIIDCLKIAAFIAIVFGGVELVNYIERKEVENEEKE